MPSLIRVQCTGRLAAIADSLRGVAPITLGELRRVDPDTALEIEADIGTALSPLPDETVIEVE